MNNLIKKHAKSFYWASFFLSKPVFNKCSSLYNFCRTLDDIVDDDKELEIKNIISNKNCEKLRLLYSQEFDLNYEKNFFGFEIRKDNKSIRGLNFLKLLNYHLNKNDC